MFLVFDFFRSSFRLIVTTLVTSVLAGSAPMALAQQPSPADAIVLDARDALRRRDAQRLADDRAAAIVGQHPLAAWVDYWELGNRLNLAQPAEVEAFYQRWAGTYVEDRLRNDWLLELGRRRDWANFARDFPRFRMNDDREVTCYWLLTEHLAGKDVTAAARAAWAAQRDTDDGCVLLATTMVEAKRFTPDDVWRVARLAVEFNRLRVAKFAAGLVSPQAGAAMAEIADQPARYLTRKANVLGRTNAELTALAVMRMAWSDPEAAVGQMEQRWQRALPPELASTTWAVVAKQAAIKLLPDAPAYYDLAWKAGHRRGQDAIEWTDDTLAWGVRATLRAGRGRERWEAVLRYIGAMSPAEQKDAAWVYWKARAIAALSPPGAEGEAARAQSRELLQSIAGPLGFYPLLAAEDLGEPVELPLPPTPLMPLEREQVAALPGLQRALQLVRLGLRDEARREWNFTLRGLSDRQLLAAAAMACEVADWQLCINTSERTRSEIDIEQRYPMPYRDEITAQARALGLEPAYVMGLIRQETRFMATLRSYVGATGLMQLMPTTASWMARKMGVPYAPDQLTDPATNLRLGTNYLKKVLDDFDGSQAMAAAAYNAGPTRPRRWREGPVMEAAIWAENVPFTETRDYVKKVLANAAMYSMLLDGQPLSVKARLGATIGPRPANEPPPNAELP
jgi:soluble lytic murein transglycosylase